MGNLFKFKPGQEYRVVKSFSDYDGLTHPIGEKWTFVETNFVPYDDGLTLHVLKDRVPVIFRFQWRNAEQADLIENFNAFVEIGSTLA